MTRLDSPTFGPSEIGQETRELAALAHQAIRCEPKPYTIGVLLKRAHRFERRLIRYTESTGAPLNELRTWVSSLCRELASHRDRC